MIVVKDLECNICGSLNLREVDRRRMVYRITGETSGIDVMYHCEDCHNDMQVIEMAPLEIVNGRIR